MVKLWECKQCGNSVNKGVIKSLGGPPEECSHCGNSEFEEPIVRGWLHSKLDGVA